MNKVCIYTCITNGYDKLLDPHETTDDVDYICFTDNMHIKSKVWSIKQIPEDLLNLPPVLQQRILKICPHRYLQDYDASLWIDGNIQVCKKLDQFFQEYDLSKCPLYVRMHPGRNCIYREADAVIRYGKADASEVEMQMEKYKKVGYPEHAGLAETCILLRAHNNRMCKLVCNAWAKEVLMHTHRDQLSFNYACWTNHFAYDMLNVLNIYNNQLFKYKTHIANQ